MRACAGGGNGGAGGGAPAQQPVPPQVPPTQEPIPQSVSLAQGWSQPLKLQLYPPPQAETGPKSNVVQHCPKQGVVGSGQQAPTGRQQAPVYGLQTLPDRVWVQSWQAAPPVPQAVAVSPVWQLPLPSQQPLQLPGPHGGGMVVVVVVVVGGAVVVVVVVGGAAQRMAAPGPLAAQTSPSQQVWFPSHG